MNTELVPQKKSNEDIKAFWLDKALSMQLSSENTEALLPDVVQALSAAQQSCGPAVWNNPAIIEDTIREVLIHYPGQL